MRLLILGGTSFVGRYITQLALDDGHDVTLFNRGLTNNSLFPSAERRRGDRDTSDLASLATGEWDAVIDVNGYVPRHVREAVELLSGRVGTYCFISTGSVYTGYDAPVNDEDSRLAQLADPTVEEVTDQTYGGLKVLCEQVVQTSFGARALIVRPGIVAGPHDPTDRFTYWVRRLARGGRVLGPERPDQPVQVVHAGDQAKFVLDLIASGTGGVFNSVGPDDPATFADLIDACRLTTDVDVVWVSDAFRQQHDVALPLALPASGDYDGLFRISNQRGRAHGLCNRPLRDTAADVLGWDAGRLEPLPFEMAAEREAELLAAAGATGAAGALG